MLKIVTTVELGTLEYKVESSDFDVHEEKLEAVKALVERKHKLPVCIWCKERIEDDSIDDKFCCLECAEAYYENMNEASHNHN